MEVLFVSAVTLVFVVTAVILAQDDLLRVDMMIRERGNH